jgi:hypothetical protein
MEYMIKTFRYTSISKTKLQRLSRNGVGFKWTRSKRHLIVMIR